MVSFWHKCPFAAHVVLAISNIESMIILGNHAHQIWWAEIHAGHLSLTSHGDINGVQSCSKHFNDHLIWIVYNREGGIFREPQNLVAAIFFNNPGRHGAAAHPGSAEEPGVAAPPTCFHLPCKLTFSDRRENHCFRKIHFLLDIEKKR